MIDSVPEGLPMTVIAVVYLGDKINSWRKNGSSAHKMPDTCRMMLNDIKDAQKEAVRLQGKSITLIEKVSNCLDVMKTVILERKK